MHIPAMDSIRHERMGTMTSEDNSVIMLVQAYVQTDETDEMGAYDPIEGIARPFPYLATTDSKTVYVENFIQDSKLEPVSDTLIEYAHYLYKSAENQEWVDEIDEYENDMFNEVEKQIASGLFTYTINECPLTLWRMMYESANKFITREQSDNLFTNPLRDIEGKERYNFSYLPSPEDVDSWDLKYYHSDFVDDEIHVHSESIWVRYTIGDTTEERPLIIMKNKESVCMAMSTDVSYGVDDENDASKSLIDAILAEDMSYDSALVTEDISELEGTNTLRFLQNY